MAKGNKKHKGKKTVSYKKKQVAVTAPENQSYVRDSNTNSTISQSKSQKYSALVFNTVQSFVESNQDKTKRYKSLCKRAGGLLRTVGLVQFLTYLAAKATKESEQHHRYLLEQLMNELNTLKLLPAQNTEKFLEEVRKQQLPEYMRTTTEVLQLLQWHKRIADILITGED